MAEVVTVENGVSILQLEEVVIGSQLKIAVLFERLISENPDVFEPITFTGFTFKAEVKDKPSREILFDTEFDCVPRVGQPGWVDFTLDGDKTGLLEQRTYQASVKVWPNGFPENGDTLLVIVLPMKFKATR